MREIPGDRARHRYGVQFVERAWEDGQVERGSIPGEPIEHPPPSDTTTPAEQAVARDDRTVRPYRQDGSQLSPARQGQATRVPQFDLPRTGLTCVPVPLQAPFDFADDGSGETNGLVAQWRLSNNRLE